MVVTLGQQYNVGEKPTVILYTYINRHAGTPEKTKQKPCSTSPFMVIIIYCYIGYKYKATTWYLSGFSNGSNLGSYLIYYLVVYSTIQYSTKVIIVYDRKRQSRLLLLI